MMHQERTYRERVDGGRAAPYRVVVKETDLLVHAPGELMDFTRERILWHRGVIESYIRQFPEFATTLTPWPITGPAPLIIREMAEAGQKAGVGPMAAVAGAVAERVGMDLSPLADEVIVENGGDVFIKSDRPMTVAIYAGDSPLSLRIGLKIHPRGKPTAVCTSSGSFGHSLSLGKADAVCVVSESCALADAAATSAGNRVKTAKNLEEALDFGRRIEGVAGMLAIMGDKIAAWGEVELTRIEGKKG
ncbi:MAG: UPF0280 family protein [Desulfobacterales bacterium]|nr:UPF0280 family protein [Desulfobacterales bacterium]